MGLGASGYGAPHPEISGKKTMPSNFSCIKLYLNVLGIVKIIKRFFFYNDFSIAKFHKAEFVINIVVGKMQECLGLYNINNINANNINK